MVFLTLSKKIFNLSEKKDSTYQNYIERSLCEQSVCEIYKNLGLWDNLKLLTENTNQLELQVETAWRQKDFSRLSYLLSSQYFENSSSFYYLCQVKSSFNKYM